MRMSSRRSLKTLALLVGALGVAMCVDGTTGPNGPLVRASFAFAPIYEANAHAAVRALADEGLPLDRVRIVLVRPAHDTLKDTTVTMHEGDPPLTLELSVAASPNESLDAAMQFKSGETVLFEGTTVVKAVGVSVSGTGTPVEILVTYVGPGAAATKVVVTPATGIYPVTSIIQFTGTALDNSDATFPNTPFLWSVNDATLGTISTDGLFSPSGKAGALIVTAETPKGLKGTAAATLALQPASIVVVSGDNQSAAVTQQLAQPLVVQVRAADGTGVPGQTVTFAATDGGVVTPTAAVTGATGQAQTTLKVGTRIGAYNFTAAAAGFTVGAKAAATLGAPKKMVIVGPAAFTVTSGVAAANASSVKVVDDGDNPVPNVAATVDITLGAATTSVAATSDANGLITLPAAFALSAKKGVYTVAVSNATLTGSPVSFTVTVVAGAAAKLAVGTQPQATVGSGALFSPQPAIQLVDANANAVAQAGVVVTVALGEPTLNGTTTATTDASGLATFTNLSITGVPGPRTLTFTATGLTSITAPVALVAGPPKSLTVVNPQQTAVVGTPVGSPQGVRVADDAGNPVSGVSVHFHVDAASGSPADQDVVTNASGIATPASWTLGAVGSNTMVASIAGTGITNNPATITATGTSAAANHLGLVTSIPTTVRNRIGFTTGLSVRVLDPSDNPVSSSGKVVTLTLTNVSGTASLVAGPQTATTDASGIATFAGVIIGGTGGVKQLTFASTGLGSVTGVTTLIGGLPAGIVSVNGNNQQSNAGTAVGTPPRVRVIDVDGNGVRDVPVVFTVTGGSGSVPVPQVLTNADGEAFTPWALGAFVGPNVLTATAMDTVSNPVGFIGFPGGQTLLAASFAGNPVAFYANGVVGPAAHMVKRDYTDTTYSGSITVSVTVTDAFGNPVLNAPVTFTIDSTTGLSIGNLRDFSGPVTTPLTVSTNSFGVAYVNWDMGPDGGDNGLIASTSGPPSVTFRTYQWPPASPPLARVTKVIKPITLPPKPPSR